MADRGQRALPAGWPVAHWYYRIDRARWRAVSDERKAAAVRECEQWLRSCGAEEGLQLIPMAGVTKADVGFLAVHPEIGRIQRLGQEIAASEFGACLQPVYSFLSLSEASEYTMTLGDWARELIDQRGMDPAGPEFAANMAGFRKRMAAYVDARVHPRLPDNLPVLCFYPMRKARTDARNWYTLPFEERKRLMGGHGAAGRRYADRVVQLVTSATGVDDWEWGVTLFSTDLQHIRDIVYEMRFDPASAIYGEFGPFYIGIRFRPEELASLLKLL